MIENEYIDIEIIKESIEQYILSGHVYFISNNSIESVNKWLIKNRKKSHVPGKEFAEIPVFVFKSDDELDMFINDLKSAQVEFGATFDELDLYMSLSSKVDDVGYIRKVDEYFEIIDVDDIIRSYKKEKMHASIRDFETALFDEWSDERDRFVTDGVVDVNEFMASDVKVGFLLKEVNSEDGNWDLRGFVASGGQEKSWNMVTRWMMGIRNINSDLDWNVLDKIDDIQRLEYLKSIAVINLKKSNGGSVSDMKEIAEHAENDKEFIGRQIDYYGLDILICCGTSDVYHKYVAVGKKKWQMSRKGLWYYRNHYGGYVIAWKHPQMYVDGNMLYYPLVDTVREILETKRR